MLGFATRRQSDAVHALNWKIPSSSSRIDTFEAAAGVKIKFEWSRYHSFLLMPSVEAAEACDFTGSTSLGAISPVEYTVPQNSPSTTLSFAREVRSHCTNGQRLNVNMTSLNPSKAEMYYLEALDLWPESCGAMGYVAELYMTTGKHSASKNMMARLWNTCEAITKLENTPGRNCWRLERHYQSRAHGSCARLRLLLPASPPTETLLSGSGTAGGVFYSTYWADLAKSLSLTLGAVLLTV